ncbi:MAG: twin-arginine translocase subunit TatC, partial [Collinsella intestinalis]
FEWLLEETRSIGAAMPQLEDFINTELLLMIGFGVSFELPLIVFYLAVFHIVPYASFRAAWRYVYVIMLVVSASITPDASPVTLIFMYAVMLSLYEVSLMITRFVVVARDGKAGLTESRLASSATTRTTTSSRTAHAQAGGICPDGQDAPGTWRAPSRTVQARLKHNRNDGQVPG